MKDKVELLYPAVDSEDEMFFKSIAAELGVAIRPFLASYFIENVRPGMYSPAVGKTFESYDEAGDYLLTLFERQNADDVIASAVGACRCEECNRWCRVTLAETGTE
jgi:hypothetical protein